jgi:hypothetical protein
MQLMTHAKIPDFSSSELWIVESTLSERYRGQIPEIMQADGEIRLNPGDRSLTEVPCLIWKVESCTFVIFKSGEERYRCQFFYSVRHQYGTGIDEFDNIGDCVTTLLKMQADHEATQAATN